MGIGEEGDPVAAQQTSSTRIVGAVPGDRDVQDTLDNFERLFIGRAEEIAQAQSRYPRRNSNDDIVVQSTDDSPRVHRRNSRRRWSPYQVPRKKSATRSKTDAPLFRAMSWVQWREEVDVEELRHKLFDKRLLPISCAVQATQPPQEERDLEVEELSEYFEHFVTVNLKMSALAESMYV